ncbi:MAG: hypothetical protein IT308_12380 [Anaerolineaceae bacterium]|nr:hypothetical protein [Anaerolineaceae bacterium]
MVLMEHDGITVEAISELEVAEYKRLGFQVVEPLKEPKADNATLINLNSVWFSP